MLLSQFKTSLAANLGDSNMIYWTSPNLDLIIKEALLTFGAISSYWKSKILIETKNNQQLYNLLDVADIKSGATNIQSSLTYQDIINWIDTDLIGYIDLLDVDEIIIQITKAINLFQTETKLVLAIDRFNIEVGQFISIDNTVLDIIAAYYIDSSGKYYALQRADENSISLVSFDSTQNPAKPRYYSINNLSLEVVDLFPRPIENGFLELIYVVGKDNNQTLESSCLLPNNLVPYLKYKILKDIFDIDTVNDPYRSSYCSQRWREGLLIGNNYAAIVNTKLNGINKIQSSILDFDKLRYGWRNAIEEATKKPTTIGIGGYNILAIDKMPVLNPYSIMLECVSNAPINEIEIDIRPDYIPVLNDYCLHLAAIKDGIVSIQKTQNNLERFIKDSAYHNEYLRNRRIGYLDLLGKSKYPLKQINIQQEKENAA